VLKTSTWAYGRFIEGVGSGAERAVADPVSRPRPEPRRPVLGVGQLAAVERQAPAPDALRQPELDALELCDLGVDASGPAAREARPVAAGRRAVRRQLGELRADLVEGQSIRCAKTMNAIRRSTGRG
jgi:hypothetical protein